MKTDKKVILLVNLDKAHAGELGRDVLQWLGRHAEVIGHNLDGNLDLANLPEAVYLVVLGGDGTILSSARGLQGRQLPIIGVNIGKLGFLAEFSIDELKEHFDQIVSDQALVTQRIMLDCQFTGPERREGYNVYAVNELAIIADPPFRMIEVSVSIADEHLALCMGDGLIVSTPTGSTAYNLSAGGPILMSTLTSAVITPMAAHSLTFRPMVVDLDKPIILQCRDNRHPIGNRSEQSDTVNCGIAAIDGQVTVPLKSQDKIIVTRAETRFLLVRNPRQSQWRLLNTKLHWGAMPKYRS
ncbi:MAG: NAD(+)/NADH kinase [Planctomycetes bacterium]|nr:NAD(+)/NADH kinase [Planctomycetota bacterium]